MEPGDLKPAPLRVASSLTPAERAQRSAASRRVRPPPQHRAEFARLRQQWRPSTGDHDEDCRNHLHHQLR